MIDVVADVIMRENKFLITRRVTQVKNIIK